MGKPYRVCSYCGAIVPVEDKKIREDLAKLKWLSDGACKPCLKKQYEKIPKVEEK